LFYFSGPVGGLRRAFEILKEQVKAGKTDIVKLIRYAVKFPSISTRKRIGFALEKAGINDRKLAPLLKSVRKTSLVTVYPSASRKGRINKNWMVIENAT
jgi:predicted transcriptional regulator of viral defense system